MPALNDYYLLKCFSKAKYREDFNSGEMIYINNVKYFWNLENTFQKDQEGVIFSMPNEAYLLRTKPGFEKIVKGAKSVDEILNKMGDWGQIISKVRDTVFSINGYILCFYLLHKSDIYYDNGIVYCSNEKSKNDLVTFLKGYSEDNKDYYISVYDAKTLCELLNIEMLSRGYDFEMLQVKYKDLSDADKIDLYRNKDFESLVFTKSVEYNYQREFRIFVSKKGNNEQDHIELHGINISDSLVCNIDGRDISI